MRRDDVTLFSTADWDNPFWTNKQHVAVELARRGHRVLYVESVGLRRPSASAADLRRIGARLLRLVRRPRQVRDRMWVWTPPVLPVQRYAAVRVLNRMALQAGLAIWGAYLGFRADLLWTYNPMTTALLSLRPYRKVVYHCVDEIKAQPGMPALAIERAERDLLAQADVVFATSTQLYETRRRGNPNTHYLPNVADFDHFSRALAKGTEIPQDLDAIPTPRIGFVGAISGYKLDFSLLDYIARTRPTWQLVLIGKVGEGDPWTDTRQLAAHPNVHVMGPRPYAQLPQYLRGLDVTILPNCRNEYTAAMFPMKFFEYLAAGRPVVSIDLPALAAYREVAYLATSPEDFVEGIESALRGDAPPLERRLAEARANTYAARTARMMELVDAVSRPEDS